MGAVTTVLNPDDPATLGYPATLPIEVAMRTAPVRRICEAYGLSEEDWDTLRYNPTFIADVLAASEALRKDGVSFKMKARLQAEALLATSWQMIKDKETPGAVRADLIKATVRWAGLDDPKGTAGGGGNNFQINLNLG